MKTKRELPVFFEELTPCESQEINGGLIIVPAGLILAAAILSPLALACGISYYAGYAVGKLTCDN